MEKLEKVAEQLNAALKEKGLAPGSVIWRAYDACHECEDEADHCGIDCEKKGKMHLENTTVLRAHITVGDGIMPFCTFTDGELNKFFMKDIGVTVFTDREEAAAKLWPKTM